jgi:hypothetical protein
MVGTVGVIIGTFLPMARSGAATRTSYEVVAAAERLEVVTGALATVAQGWYLVPLLAVAAWLAAALRASGLLLALCISLLMAVLSLSVVVHRSPLAFTAGAAGAPLAGAVAVVGAARYLWERRGHERRHRTGSAGRSH